ncbi:MAG TPA: FtsX-like permease family protein [Phycisphaerae bacterium]|nr:FtsX-like permease family protein [Phycisphaerae bacterium]
MRSRLALILFIVFAPVAVPIYGLFLVATNLLGGAFYIVIEATAARLVGRPISLTRGWMILLAIPVLVLAPLAAAVHLLLWFIRLVGWGLCWAGRWQTGTHRTGPAFVAGLIWVLAAFWTTLTCLNAAMGLSLVGRPVQGRELFVEYYTRSRTLGQMPPQMQERRQTLIKELQTHQEASHPQWEQLLAGLQDDECLFRWLPNAVAWRLAGLPWFFMPAELSDDGLDHSVLLLGPLLLVWMLLIRWPGTFSVLKWRVVRGLWFLVRAIGVVWAIYALAAWVPWRAHSGYWFGDLGPPTFFRILSPAMWLGVGPSHYVPPEWLEFNAGLWLMLIGVVAFIWWLAWRISPFLGWPRYYVAFISSRLLQRKRIAFFSVGAVTLCVAMMIIVISVMGGFVDSIRLRAHGLLGDLIMDGGLQGFPYYDEFIKRLGDLKDKDGQPVVVQATPLIHSYGILQFPKTKRTKAVRIWGVRLNEYVRVNEFGKDLFYQNRFGGTVLTPQQQPVYGFDDNGIAVLPDEMDKHFQAYLAGLPPEKEAEEEKLYRREPNELYPGPGVFEMASGTEPRPGYQGKPFPGVIIGRDVIFQRMPSGEYHRSQDCPRGEQCFLTVLPLTRGGDISSEPPPKPSFRYVDDSRTGIHEIDSMNVYVDFDELQRLMSMGPQPRADGSGLTAARCSQIQIKLRPEYGNDRRRLEQIKRPIMQIWDQLRQEVPADGAELMMMAQVEIQTWEEMQQSYISAIEKEKFLVLIMFGVISIVAVFLILCIFYMIVQEKIRDIGIIKSVGGSAEGVAAVFLAYGGAIGLVGCVLGSLLGITFVEHINGVQDWLARLNPDWRVWSPETYSFDKIPDVWKWSEVIWISVLAVISSILGATAPAIRASRTWPVESLRYE